ncbi:MAG: dihydrolipoyl dehydrogenase [Desulfuromonadaceae bacterium]|nr:dihydrolipoyl dehydrogenase [Desulfuromonadaceae bacterium]MDD2848104.1 dihydrolipoyl dehydrogenase [Desulfuromonadaceae bacterium]MDD4132055.1 dihydrolipoyl dehydrogenase [Desulfuromonadaceae bacterium]
MQTFDVVVIGGGPGGMNAGMMLNQMGKSVALIQENQDSFGGVCLNRGCMPTKSLLKAAKVHRDAKQAEKYGLDIQVAPVDLKRLRAVMDKDLDNLRTMVQGMISGAQVTTFRGKGSFQSAHEILIDNADGSTALVRGEQIIIATGSESIELPFALFDGQQILSSDQMLKNTVLPEKLLIVGGGAIGCEFATLYHSFGSEVVLVEALETLLPREDQEAGKALQAAFENQGIKVKTGTMIEQVTVENGQVKVKYKGIDATTTVDKILVGVGRKPNIAGLNLEAAGVKTELGAVSVNQFMQTSVPHIYALGDAIGGLMLAHAAEKEGKLLAMNMVQGASIPLEESAVPRVAFSHPEVAAVGTSEAAVGIRTFTMPLVPNGRSVVDKVAPAFVKLFIEEETMVIAGAIIIGEAATEMIHEMALAVENRLTLDQIGKTVHAHPTHSTNVVKAVHHFN